jgi:hypothetical protein
LTIDANGSDPFVYRGPLALLKVIGVGAGSVLNVDFYGQHRQQ